MSRAMAMAMLLVLLLALCAACVPAEGSSSAFPLDGLDQSDRKLYHSASILAYDYQDMLEQFRLYIYPVNNATSSDFRQDESAGTDDFFFNCLAAGNGEFLTDDPEEADLFMLPVSIGALWRHGGSGRIAHSLRGYIQQLRDSYPYWQRALGADHVFISCQDFKSDWSRNVLELKKNAIQVACFPLAGAGQEFFPHKDVSMPPLDDNEKGASVADGFQRDNLAYFAAADPSLLSVYESWTEDPDFVQSLNESSHLEMLLTSKFCFSVGSKDRKMIIDALRHGCVPVIFSEGKLHDLPFQDVLDWHQFAVVLNRDQMSNVRKTLEAIDESQYARMQASGARAAQHMEWHSPPKPHDAFYMLLYQLWRRHHSIRYADQL